MSNTRSILAATGLGVATLLSGCSSKKDVNGVDFDTDTGVGGAASAFNDAENIRHKKDLEAMKELTLQVKGLKEALQRLEPNATGNLNREEDIEVYPER